MAFRLNKGYLCAFIIVLIIEIIIGVFVRDNFIRPYVGDVLVTVLIYCFIKSFVANELKLLPLYVFIFACLVEIGQYFNLVDLLGLGNNKIARIIIGTHFDLMDIVCYLVGCIGLFLFQIATKRHTGKSHQQP
ncbi:MAG: DUF2809 domain-containing protein [Bacteroidales bacterium]|nr:DUF2809 domain-containing protein [Bacteroidales bacterium]